MSDRAVMNVNPFPPDTSLGHPVLDEVVNLGAMAGTTIRQMRERAQALFDEGAINSPVEGGLATAVIFLVDRIEEMSA